MFGMATEEPADTSDAPKRIRLIIDTTDRIRRAVQLRAFRMSADRAQKVSTSDFVNELFEEILADELADIDRKDSKRKR
jgi:hypothetical protein